MKDMSMYDLLDPVFFKSNRSLCLRIYRVTGSFNGSIIKARCEGDARRLFHYIYRGESIIDIRVIAHYS